MKRFLNKPSILCLVVASIILCSATDTMAGKTIRWKLKPGQQFHVQMTQDMTQSVTVGDRKIETPYTMTSDMTMVVDKVNEDGTFNIAQTIDRMQVKMKAPGVGEIKFDTLAKDEPVGPAKMFADLLKPMVGVKFTQKMDDRGKISDVQFPKEAFKGIASNPLAKQMMSEESLKKMILQGSPVLPAEAIDKGHQFTQTIDNKTPVGQMIANTTYTYEGVQKLEGKALDKFGIEMNMEFGKAAGPLGASVKVVEQDNKGALYFDNDAGFIRESTLNQNMKMELTIGQQKIDQNIKTITRLIYSPVKKD